MVLFANVGRVRKHHAASAAAAVIRASFCHSRHTRPPSGRVRPARQPPTPDHRLSANVSATAVGNRDVLPRGFLWLPDKAEDGTNGG